MIYPLRAKSFVVLKSVAVSPIVLHCCRRHAGRRRRSWWPAFPAGWTVSLSFSLSLSLMLLSLPSAAVVATYICAPVTSTAAQKKIETFGPRNLWHRQTTISECHDANNGAALVTMDVIESFVHKNGPHLFLVEEVFFCTTETRARAYCSACGNVADDGHYARRGMIWMKGQTQYLPKSMSSPTRDSIGWITIHNVMELVAGSH